MATTKAATPASPPAAAPAGSSEKKAKDDVQTYAFEFKLLKDKIGAATTNKQVKSKVAEAFMGYGAHDETRVTGDVGADRTVVIFFARLFGKGQPAWDSLVKGEKATIKVYDEEVELARSDAKPSGGGAATGTAFLPKKEHPKGEKKKGGRGKEGKEGKDGKEGDEKDGEGRGRGRGRGRGGPKKEEVKGPSLQRGRANIGGKLGQPSKIQLAKAEKAKKAKEIADRLARGEKIEEIKEEKKEEDPEAHIVKKGKEDPKAAKGKAEGGKKEGGKKEGGKAEAGKKDAGKKEAGKAEGKKEGAKKGK